MTIRAHSPSTEATISAASPLPSLPSTSASVDGSARTLTELARTTADLPEAEQPASDAHHLVIIFAIALAVVAVLGVLYWLLT